MTEEDCLKRMIAPGTKRLNKFRSGVIQILLTRACDNSCFNCTQGSNLGGKPMMMTPSQFEIAVKSLVGYFGVVGIFGGNPVLNPHFEEICEILRKYIPFEQRGLWCNNPINQKNVAIMRETFNPQVSNLNVHLDKEAFKLFKQGWPESMPFGQDKDSRHAPVHLAMKDIKELLGDENAGKRWDLISNCDINQHWSALIGVFRDEVQAWFCEVAGAQAMLHQDDPGYPDTGMPVDMDKAIVEKGSFGRKKWWQLPMGAFRSQVRKHCHECGVPLRGHGELAMSTSPDAIEQTSITHQDIFKPKRKDRKVEIVSEILQLGTERVGRVIDYLKNGA